MASNIKGPAIFLAQFAGDKAPFNSLDSITKWAGSLGYKGVQIPTWDGRLFDLKKAAESKTYCDEVKGVAKANGVEITELSTHLQGQLVAVNPAYDEAFDAFAPAAVQGKPKERQKWATEQLMLGAKASKNLGLTSTVSFTGALACPMSIPGRSGPKASSKPPSANWPGAGSPFLMPMMRRALTWAMKSIRARMCSTAPPLKCSSMR